MIANDNYAYTPTDEAGLSIILLSHNMVMAYPVKFPHFIFRRHWKLLTRTVLGLRVASMRNNKIAQETEEGGKTVDVREEIAEKQCALVSIPSDATAARQSF